MRVNISTENNEKKIEIGDESNLLEIWPGCGGILNSWTINQNDWTKAIISGYESFKDFSENRETKGFRSCKLSPFVCRINNSEYNLKGEKIKIGKFGFDHHNIHGLIYDLPFDIINHFQNEDEAGVQLKTIYENISEGFPFKCSVEITYKLKKGNELIIITEVNNLSTEIMPLCDGWHPYFNIGENINNCLLKINSNKKLEFDKELIPTGDLINYDKFTNSEIIENTFLDNCFLLKDFPDPACELTDPQSEITLKLYNEKNYPYLQLFTPDDRKSIAIEPLSAAPDAFNNKMGLINLDPGKSIEFICRWVWE